jgi:predicted nucleic acid-binding protein
LPSPSLGRQSVYDAAYIALAQSLEADLWTLDGPLAGNARSVGLLVQLLGPHSAPPILS